MPPRSDRFAVYAGLYAGLCFGIFWLPIRLIESGGFSAPWALVVFTGLPALLCLPLAWRMRLDYARGGWELAGGVLAGAAYALYAGAMLYTDVVRAVLLFYLMPIWGFLLGWLILKERITWYQWLAIGLGVLGMVVVFTDETGLPLPRNLGDWFGLVSGFLWAVGSLLILTARRVRIATQALNFFIVAAVLVIVVVLAGSARGLIAPPDWGPLPGVLIWFVPVAVLLVLPAGFAAVFAPSRLNPGVVGLLFMMEIVIAAITAALWAGEPFTWREIVGLPLILSAGLVESVVVTFRRRSARSRA